MSDESLELDETSIYDIIWIKEKEDKEKEVKKGKSETKGGERETRGLSPPPKSDKDSGEETYETPENRKVKREVRQREREEDQGRIATSHPR